MLLPLNFAKFIIMSALAGAGLHIADTVAETGAKKTDFETSSTLNYALSKLGNPLWLGIVGLSAYAIYKVSFK